MFKMVKKHLGLLIFACVMSTAFIAYRTVYTGSVIRPTVDWVFTRILNIRKSTDTLTSQAHDHNRVQLYEDRRQTVMKGCAQLNMPITNSFNTSKHMIDASHNIIYCPIAKVGSTFWSRTLEVFNRNGSLKTPYEITLKGVNKELGQDLSEATIKSIEKNGDSFLIVRDPYARLFSGYENKIYLPNPGFWKSVSSKVIKAVRPSHTDVKYGFDVTFPEFIKYVIYTQEHGKYLNGHFTPMYKQCNPCRTHYKYIGLLETFTDDAEYLLSKWRKNYEDITLQFGDIYKEAAIDAARSFVSFLYSTKPLISNIKYPFINLLLRTWRDFQIRGYISKHTEFPYHGDVSDVTELEFRAKIADALAQPQNRSAVKQQRTEALVQAYKQVPLEDMEKLRKFVLTDCVLFGYDDRPSQLFDRTQASNDNFVYLDGISTEPYQYIRL